MMHWKQQPTNDSDLNQSLMFPSNFLNGHFNLDFWQFWQHNKVTLVDCVSIS